MSAVSGAKIKFDQACVFVREVGEGRPLLLINGLGAHTAMWEPLERTLEGFRIVEFDLPGAGRSDVPWKPLSVPRLAQLAASVMDQFGLGQADVLGYSMGGIVAQQLAADAPERVRRLVLAATTPGMGAVQGDLRALLNILTPVRYQSAQLYAKTIGSLAGGRARRDQAWVAQQGALRLKHAPSWRGYLGQLASIATWSGLPFHERIEQPTLVLAGDDDPLTPVVNGMIIAFRLPRARLVVLRDEGHLMLIDPDSECHPAIRDFLFSDDLEASETWAGATDVDAQELRIALAGAGIQIPPMSIANALMRRRFLDLDAQAA